MRQKTRNQLKTWLMIAFFLLAIHDLMLILGSVFLQTDIKTLLIQRLTEPGDAVRYLDLAQNGYTTIGENRINLVFYPLYPLLMRGLGLIIGNLATAGMILSRLAYAGAGVLLYELILLDGDKRRAWDGVILLGLYPFSIFATGVYTEGLFLFLTIACLYALRKQNFVLAGCVGFLAALTRTQGVLLLFPAVYEWLVELLQRPKRHPRWRDGFLFLIPAGFCVYLGINYALYGNCFQFLEFEAAEPWFQTTEWIADNIALQFDMGQNYSGLNGIIYTPQIILYFAALGVLIYGIRQKTRMSFLLYGGVYLGFTYLSGWMISGGRYMFGCVPIYIILSGLKEGLARNVLMFVMGILFFAYSMFFLYGFAIM